jgi:hypothetical protein
MIDAIGSPILRKREEDTIHAGKTRVFGKCRPSLRCHARESAGRRERSRPDRAVGKNLSPPFPSGVRLTTLSLAMALDPDAAKRIQDEIKALIATSEELNAVSAEVIARSEELAARIRKLQEKVAGVARKTELEE